MRRACALVLGPGGGVGGFLVDLLGGLAAGVGVVEAVVCGAVDEGGAVGLGGEGDDEEGGEGVDGVVWGGHLGVGEGDTEYG